MRQFAAGLKKLGLKQGNKVRPDIYMVIDHTGTADASRDPLVGIWCLVATFLFWTLLHVVEQLNFTKP